MSRPDLAAKLNTMLQRGGAWFWNESPPVGAPQGRFTRQGLSEFMAYQSWDPVRDIFGLSKTVGFVLELVPLIGADDTTARILSELFGEALPAGCFCQVISYASPKIAPIIDEWAVERAKGGQIYDELAKHRREHFRKAVFSSGSAAAPFYFRDFRVLVSIELTGALGTLVVDELVEVREKLVSALRTIHTPARVVDPAMLIAFAEDILNPTSSVRPAEPHYDPDQWIANQIMRSDTTWTVFRNCIVSRATRLGDELHGEDHDREASGREELFEMRGFSPRKFPDNWSQGQMARTLGDMFNDQLRLVGSTLSCLCFSPWTSAKTNSTTEFKRMRSDQAASSPLTKAFPAVRKKAEDWANVAEDVSNGALLSNIGLFIVSISPRKDAERAERALRSVWQASGFTLQRDDDIHIQTVLACLPMGIGSGLFEDLKSLGRLRVMPTTVAARIAPMQGEYLGGEVPHMLLVGRRGQTFYWSNFGNSNGNHNAIVVGSSGSGKSVLMQDIATSLRGADADVFVIDDGRSFKSSCELQGGKFIVFSLDLDVCLNPFSMADHRQAGEDREYEAECKRNIVLQVEQMCRGQARATPEELGAIETCVGAVWELKGPDGRIDDVRDALAGRWFHDGVEENGMPEAEALLRQRLSFGTRGADLALSLSAFTTSGTYGRFFNGPATLVLDNAYTVFEMAELETKKDLRAVVILCVLFAIRQGMRKGGRQRRKALIVDEAWALLGDGATGEFIEGFARRCRKEGGSIIAGTQSIEDFYRTAGAKACLQNSDWQIMLRLLPEALEQLRNDSKLAIDEAGMQLLKSLKTSEGEYSEMMIKGPTGRFVGRLVLDPYSVTLYSTRPAVFAGVQRLVAAGVAVHEAVRCIAFNEEPQLQLGAAAE